ncbi:MAG: glycogen synthase GlgA [Deltaproteobacteria bacterium]|nr:glycogen synthase GlgA [Deltaproteobacteria bacterium]
MNILFAVSEAAPFAKTGGLADVAGALPGALASRGHQVYLFLPFYREVRKLGTNLNQRLEVSVPLGDIKINGNILELNDASPNLKIFFVEKADFFDRPFLYGPSGTDYPDNGIRFIFFCRAILESVRQLNLAIDLYHAHDWQTALLPVYLKTLYRDQLRTRGASLFTIHNLAYQGLQDKDLLPLTGLGWEEFTLNRLEFFDRINLLKGGLVYADALSTVSPTYSREILEQEFGCGLEGVLQQRRNDLFGILNGVDYEEWNPAADPYLDDHFHREAMAGKQRCKEKLALDFGLPLDPSWPLIGMVSRLVEQKGFDLILALLREVESFAARFIFLGTGNPAIENNLAELSRRHPTQIVFSHGYDNRLAHLIEAGADIFMMPSRYEPCGLNQMYSLRYGTVPLVRAVGGLADSISGYDPETGAGNGFKFNSYSPGALKDCLQKALQLYQNQDQWQKLRDNGMSQDFSWNHSASEYETLYQKIITRVQTADPNL